MTAVAVTLTVQELYAALGGEPVTGPYSAAVEFNSVYIEVPAHPPKCLVCMPLLSKLWALCNGSVQNMRVNDFGQPFYSVLRPRTTKNTANICRP